VAKYIWVNSEYRGKNKSYNWAMIILMAITLACLYLLPEDIRMLNMIPIVVAIFCWIQAWRYRIKDKMLKVSKNGKKPL